MSDARYEHQTYGLGVTIKKEILEVRFHKKPWVPKWLWKLVSVPDNLDLPNTALDRAIREEGQRLIDKLCAPMNEKMEEESKFAKAMGLRRADYPERLNLGITIHDRPEGAPMQNGVNITRTLSSTYVYIADSMETVGDGHFVLVRIPNENPKDYSITEEWENPAHGHV